MRGAGIEGRLGDVAIRSWVVVPGAMAPGILGHAPQTHAPPSPQVCAA